MKKLTIVLLAMMVLAITFSSGCYFQQNENSKANPVSSAEIVTIVKSFIINSDMGLSEDEKSFVLNNSPEKVGSYKIASDYGQYFWSWEISNGKEVIAYGTGSLSELNDTTNTWLNVSENNEVMD